MIEEAYVLEPHKKSSPSTFGFDVEE